MKIFNLRKERRSGETFWKNNWLEFHPEFAKASFRVEKAGYFDSRPQLSFTITTGLSLIGLLVSPFIGIWFAITMMAIVLFVPWGKLYLHLPYDTGIDECESPTWGFYFYGEGKKIPDTFVICYGMKTKHIEMPWSLTWVRTSRMLKDGSWLHERKGDRKKGIAIDWYTDETQARLLKETHDYTYTLKDGTIQERKATIAVEQREWRPLWFRWTALFNKVSTDIDIEFDKEVGERTGSWKGGTIGCGWDLLPNETPLESLRRMEKVRTFR